MLCALEYGVLDKMSDAGMIASLVPRSALYAQCAETNRSAASSDCILQPAICLSAYHSLLPRFVYPFNVLREESDSCFRGDLMLAVIVRLMSLRVDEHLVAE